MKYKGGFQLMDFPSIGEESFGKAGRVLVQIAILSSQIGYCCAFVVFILSHLRDLSFVKSTAVSKYFWIFIIGITIILICLVWIRNIKMLAPTSVLANITIILSVLAVIEYGFQNEGLHKVSLPPPHIQNIAVFYGIVAFAYAQHGLILDVHRAMANPTKYGNALNAAVAFVTVLYLIFGVLGYSFFGENTDSVLTNNLVGIESDVIRISISVVLIFAYPLQMYPVTSIVEGMIFEPKDNNFDTIKRNVLRIVIVVGTAFIAQRVPYFGDFSALVGCFSNSSLAFIFPTLFYMKLFRKEMSPLMFAFNIFVLVFGIAGTVIGSVLVINKIRLDFQN